MHWQTSGASLKPCEVSRLSNSLEVIFVTNMQSLVVLRRTEFCIMTVIITALMSHEPDQGGNKGKYNGLVIYTGEVQSGAPAPQCPSYSLPQPRGAAPRMMHAHVLILPVHALVMPSL